MAAPSEAFESDEADFGKKDLGGAHKRVAPFEFSQDVVVIDSEGESEERMVLVSEAGGRGRALPNFFISRDGRRILWVPRTVSPMLRKVQEWEVDTQSDFKAGEQVEFVDSNGVVLRGTICDETREDGRACMVQVRLDFWQPGQGVYQSGCDTPHVSGRHEDYMANLRFRRPSGVQQLSVRVGAPLGHWDEVRAKPGAVRLTPRDAAVQGSGGSDAGPGIAESSSASQGASLRLELGEELLNYEEEEAVHEVAVQTGAPVEKTRMSKRAFQGDRLVGRHQELVAGNLLRSEVFGYETRGAEVGYVGLGGEAVLSSGRSQAVVDHGKGNVGVAIQVGVGEEPVAGKLEVSQGGVSDVGPGFLLQDVCRYRPGLYSFTKTVQFKELINCLQF
ncbi:hypothetical protein NDU88_000475 [Pleurodeles waltl]|uniref:Uncharacterized protein n=1 Tax=Pleurodeles waltl TaxID=8319 RepID=A0AAV7URT3_PLEWA|nr:hypothetical protein NDU88_000475 [Pleurodeles waltl]